MNTAAILRGTVASLESVSADGSTGHTEIPDSPDFDLSAGTVMFSVELNDLNGLQGLFSRDGLNNQDGGHTTVWADGDDIKVRVQNAEGPGEKSEYLYARNVLEAGEETHVAVSFDGSVTQLFIDGALIDAAAIDSSWTNADEDITVGAAATRQRDADDDNVSNVMNGTVSDLLVIDQALEPHEIQAVAGVTPTAGGFAGATPYNPDLAISGSTGTGLDTLVDIVLTDVGLAARISEADILGGAEAAHGMNEIIVEGIRALGLGNDGAISANEVRDLSDWVQADPARAQAFTVFHGDDEQNVETGFHLVQNDGAETYILGENAVNTVADGIYHLVFGYSGNNITNEDGNRNADLGDMAWWLSELLAEDLAAAASGSGALYNGAVTPYAPGVAAPWGIQLTGTGFDQIVDVVFNDPGLIRETSLADMVAGSEAAMLMSGQILSAIEAYGLLNDGDFTASDVYAVSEWIRTTPGEYAKFVAAHGNDEGDLETGYHRIQNDGAETYRNGDNAVNTVFDGIFHIGFEIANRRVTNEDGNANAAIEDVAWWISSLLEDEIESGALATGPAFAPATTGTGLDFTVETILADHGLSYKISELDIHGGAEAAAGMNEMIVQAIIDTGVAANGEIKHSDVRDINAWFQADDARYARFVELHGDDEEGIETGYHLVQNDGARLRLYDDNAVDTVFDGLYHIGFDIVNGRFQNEDGDKNASVNTVAGWLGSLLSDADLEALAALSTTEAYVHGSTGTGLDLLVNIITEDDGLATKIATSEIAAGARAAEAMNEIILEAIDGTGAALDGAITELDVYDINAYIRGDAALLEAFTLYHGDDEGDVETGFHLVQNDGARTELFDRNAVDTVADGIYHIGFEIDGGRFLNEDGNKNASVGTVAGWLNDLLAEDLDGDGLGGDDLVPDAAELADLQAAQVYGFVGPAAVSKSSGQIKVPDSDVFRLPAATIIAGFSVDDPLDEGAIFSRDSSGFDDGGHMTAWVDSEDVVVRFQSKTGEVTLRASEAVTDSDPHTLAVSFDGTLVTLFVDGVRYDAAAIEADWTETTENIWLGASAIRQGEDDDKVEDLLGGTVDFFSVYEGAFNFAEVQALIAAGPVEVPLPDGGAVVEPPEEGEEPDDPGDDPAGDPPADPPAEPAGTLSESLLLDLALYDTESDTLVTVIGPDTVYSAEDLSDMKLAIVAVAKPGVDGIGSVRIITPDGEQTENVSPYAQFGDTGGDLQGGIVFAEGEYPVEIQVFSGENGGGTLLEHVEFGFTVEEEPANAPPSDEDAPGEEDPGNGTPGDGEEPEDPATGGGTPPEDGDPAVAGLLEFGSVTTGQADAGTWHRVDFSETIVDARVVMGPMTLNGGHDAVVRVKDVTDDGFFFQIDEWDHHDGFHVVETLSWMAASEGTHTLADGTTIAAGRASAADETVVRIDMSDFTDTPAVFAQVASFNDTAAVTSRISDIDTSGFSVRMQEEEAADGLHGAEDVDWIAIGYGDGTEIDVASLDGVTHRGSDISFDAATGTVVAIADMQTFNGSDTADLRFSELGESDTRIVIREERSRDGETRHIAEDLAVLTTSEGLHELYVA
ncbi:MAG: LamG-like jellyroll fold domain-containing protein [Planctomycetota bacterium]